MKSLAEVFDFLEVEVALHSTRPLPIKPDLVIKGLSQQTQDLQQGWIFIALQGTRNHGLDFLEQAKAQGAVLVLSDKPAETNVLPVVFVPNLLEKLAELASWFYDFPAKKLNLIGVTGTNGKTSVTNYLAQLLTKKYEQVGVVGTLGVGVVGKFQPSPNTTPDVFKLQHHLAEFVSQKVSWVVLEVSSHALALQRIAGLEFKAVALTQVGADHLDFHQNLAEYKNAKKLLFTDYLAEQKITNLADGFGQELEQDNLATFSYGLEQGDLQVKNLSFTASGISGSLAFQNQELDFATEIFGAFNVENLLCATATLLALGWEFNLSLIKQINQLKPVAGRIQQIKSAKNHRVIIDYAHTADALEKLLLAIKEHKFAGKIWLVFGCGGDRDKSKRPAMGEVASKLADRVILTSDNPRYENPQQILDEIAQTTPTSVQILDRKQAIEQALQQAQAGDVLVIAGKGHEEFQEIAGKKLPFSDLEVVQAWQA